MRVAAEQSASRAGPSVGCAVVPGGIRKFWVMQKNGVSWGPEKMGPVIG